MTRGQRALVAVVVSIAVIAVMLSVSLSRLTPAPRGAAPGPAAAPFAKQLLGRVLVIGHRGDPLNAPEDTVASINAAFALGASMVEADVHFSGDGVVVVIHDETLERTTDGTGLVAQTTLADLKRLDAGSSTDRKYEGERIPTLEEALRAAAGRGPLLLDLKADGLGRAVGEALRRLDLPGSSVAIGAWTPEQVQDFVTHVPGAQILMATGQPLPEPDDEFFRRERARGITGFEVFYEVLDEAFIAAAHRHDMPVYAFTINDEPTLRRLIAMGVDGIETDDPGLLVRLVTELGRR
jgi:glycerophosphoryl diester phosphodiesterase